MLTSDLSTDITTMSASMSGLLDADTTWAVGYTGGEVGSLEHKNKLNQQDLLVVVFQYMLNYKTLLVQVLQEQT